MLRQATNGVFQEVCRTSSDEEIKDAKFRFTVPLSSDSEMKMTELTLTSNHFLEKGPKVSDYYTNGFDSLVEIFYLREGHRIRKVKSISLPTTDIPDGSIENKARKTLEEYGPVTWTDRARIYLEKIVDKIKPYLPHSLL